MNCDKNLRLVKKGSLTAFYQPYPAKTVYFYFHESCIFIEYFQDL